jgi:single-strand DNA-binding protein
VSNGTSVTVVGNLTRDPEERMTRNGETMLSFSVASSRRWKNKNDEWEEETSYFDVTAWSELARNTALSLRKGNRVIVVGRLKQESWEDKSGEKKNKIVVIAEDIGPSLRKAQIPEINRTGNTSGGQQGYRAPQQSFPDDEEPF